MTDKTDKSLGFDNKPEEFPNVWTAGDEEGSVDLYLEDKKYDISISVSIDHIINKHVYLAIDEYMSDDCWFVLGLTENNTFEVCVGLGEWWTKSFDLEHEVKDLLPYAVSKSEFLRMAESLERSAQHIRALAEKAPDPKVSG